MSSVFDQGFGKLVPLTCRFGCRRDSCIFFAMCLVIAWLWMCLTGLGLIHIRTSMKSPPIYKNYFQLKRTEQELSIFLRNQSLCSNTTKNFLLKVQILNQICSLCKIFFYLSFYRLTSLLQILYYHSVRWEVAS